MSLFSLLVASESYKLPSDHWTLEIKENAWDIELFEFTFNAFTQKYGYDFSVDPRPHAIGLAAQEKDSSNMFFYTTLPWSIVPSERRDYDFISAHEDFLEKIGTLRGIHFEGNLTLEWGSDWDKRGVCIHEQFGTGSWLLKWGYCNGHLHLMLFIFFGNAKEAEAYYQKTERLFKK